MASVMPLRAIAGAALAFALGLSLIAAAPATATTTSMPTVVTAHTVYLGEPLATRNRAITYSTRGVRPSAYIGRYYNRRLELRRRCIVQRESNGIYTALGGYYGAYQFGGAWHSGLIAMMRPSLVREVGATTAGRLLRPLVILPINRWSRYWQDRAFWTVVASSRGLSPWAGGGYAC